MSHNGHENPLDRAFLQKAYGRWAPVYDYVFGPFSGPGCTAATQAVKAGDRRVLEVGVGTGSSLPRYSRTNHLVGIDLSEAMLRRAKERVEVQGLTNVELLAVMDGTMLAFADASFDVVTALYVITAVPDPEETLNELVRVLRPGGEIVIVAHFAAEEGPMRSLEQIFAMIAHRLGWRPDFPYRRVSDWSARAGVTLLERRKTPPLGMFSLLRFVKAAA